MTTKVGTFTDGTFDVQNPTPAQQAAMLTQAQALASSAFNLVLLASMHVHDDGSLFFNNTPMINSNPAQPSGQLSPNIVTLCPFEEPDFWVNVVAQTTSNGKPQITWVNVQNAEGTLSQFVGPMQRVGIGVDALVGGLELGPDMAPYITQTFGQITRIHPGIGGGWLWNLEQYGTDNMASYASTLAAALGGKS